MTARDRIDFGDSIHLAIAAADRVESRCSRIDAGGDWVRSNSASSASAAISRAPGQTERTDFERV